MDEFERIRERILGALRENPQVVFGEDHADLVSRPGLDVAFEDLGVDSLARMELSIWIEVEYGLEMTAAEIGELGSVNRLARFMTGSGVG